MAAPSPRLPLARPRRRRPIDAEAISATIDTLYEAATDSSLWNRALAGLVSFVGSSGSHLAFIDGATGLINPDVSVGMPPEMLTEYNGDKVKSCPRIQSARRQPVGSPCYDYQHISEREIDHNEYYNWLQVQGDAIRYYLATRLNTLDGSEAWLSMAFRHREGHAQAEHMERFRMLLPHVNRAIRISQRLGTWELASASTLVALNAIDVGTFILDRDGKVQHRNAVAEALVTSGTCIRLSAGRLLLAVHAAHRQFMAMVNSASSTGSTPTAPRGGSLMVHVPNSTDVYRVTVSPLQMQSRSLAFEPTAAIVFVERVRGAIADMSTLRDRFGFTAAETRLAARLAEGQSIAEAAAFLNVSLYTARTHLKSILCKTGTHRQAALVRLLLLA